MCRWARTALAAIIAEMTLMTHDKIAITVEAICITVLQSAELEFCGWRWRLALAA